MPGRLPWTREYLISELGGAAVEYFIFLLIEAGLFFVFCKFRLLKWACFTYSILMALYCLVLGLILIYADPMKQLGMPVAGEPGIPLGVGLLFALAGFLALVPRRKPAAPPDKVTPAKWVIWAGGVILPFLGTAVFLMAIYTPSSFESPIPMAATGSWAAALAVAAGAILLYFASRLNAAAAPNRMRWWTLAALVFFLNDKLFVCALILIYAVPPGDLNYPVEASWVTLGLAPLALLMWAMAWQRVDPPRRDKAGEA